MSRLARLARQLVDEKGTALHIGAGLPVRMRQRGRLIRMEVATLSAEEIEGEIRALGGDYAWERIAHGEPADFPCELGGERYRLRGFLRYGGPALVLRATPDRASFSRLGLPSTVTRLAHLRHGLVIVSGPSGAGKSTTVAALLNEMEGGRPKHVVTIEAPIELSLDHHRTSISQREVGTHTDTFCRALDAAARQGSDVIYASDIPTAEAMASALEAVAAGKLVIATVRAAGAVRAVERLADWPDARVPILNGLAEHLSAVVSLLRLQRSDVDGHCVAAEILMRSRGVVSALRNDTLEELTEVMQQSDAMQSMDDALAGLLEQQRIAYEDAYDHARDKQRFLAMQPGARRSLRRTRQEHDY